MKFEWSNAKALLNERKHGVTFDEASTVLADLLSITIPDPLHSAIEERWITIGQSDNYRLIVVVHTESGDTIRIISARIATGYERKRYEQRHG